jgi:hypothetical protein
MRCFGYSDCNSFSADLEADLFQHFRCAVSNISSSLLILSLPTRRKVMHTISAPCCPVCGSSSPEKIRGSTAEPSGGFFSTSPLSEATCVYRCQCGATFSQSADSAEPGRQSIAALDGDKRKSLLAQANRLQRELGKIVDDPSCLIVGYDGEAYIAKLRETAKQCQAAGLSEAAERLDQLGRDVMRRWAE